MAGPIRISVLADSSAASQSMRQFADGVDADMKRASGSVSQGSRDIGGGLDAAREGFDTAETRAQGFRDGLTGAQDTMAGFAALAKGDTVGGLLLLGSGAADTASTFANFLIPTFQKGIAWIKNLTIVQRILNITMLTNPVFLVIAAIVALIAILVIAYNKSATFRAIVQGVWNTMKSAWSAIPGFVSGIVGKIGAFFTGMKDKITGFFGGAGSWLKDAAHRVIQGFIDGITAKFQAVKDTLGRLTSFLPDWKGPAPVDRKILRGAGEMVIGGFQDGLESRYSGVRDSLGKFTGSLSGDVSTGSLSGSGTAGTQRVVIDMGNRPSGGLDRMFFTWFQEYARANGITVKAGA